MVRGRGLFGAGEGSAAPRGYRAYAIGDVHGRLDLLEEILTKVQVDNQRRQKASTTVIFLGDLIDRGPQSAQVVERLRLYRPDFARTLFLMGNHEEVLLRVLRGDAALLSDWLQFGGSECVRSYGVDPEELKSRDGDVAISLLRDRIPRSHVKFLSSFVDSAAFGRYLFVHAGIRPGVPLSDQLPQDMRWIRAPFLEDERNHGFIVVHGHTITPQVDARDNRIGIDTGAYRTGVLSALGVEGDERWLMQTGTQGPVERENARVANLSEAY